VQEDLVVENTVNEQQPSAMPPGGQQPWRV
jgi:hypothetical protein